MSQKNLVDKIAKAILFRRGVARLISGLIDYDKDYFITRSLRDIVVTHILFFYLKRRTVVDMGKLEEIQMTTKNMCCKITETHCEW